MPKQRTEYELILDDKFSKDLKKANRETDRFEGEIDEASEATSDFGDELNNLAGIAAGVISGLGFNELIQDLRQTGKATTAITEVTGKTGDEAERLANEARDMGAAFDAAPRQIIRAANAISKNFNVSFEKGIELVNKGFRTGGNATGEMLEIINEFPAIFKTIGTDAEDFLGILSQASKQGIFGDRAFTTIQEFQNSLAETAEEGSDVAKAIGQLRGVTLEETRALFDAGQGIEAVRNISRAITDLDSQTEQMNIIQRIFRGAGEDVGIEFFEMLAAGKQDINALKETVSPTEQAFIQWDTAISGLMNSLSGELAPVVQKVGDFIGKFSNEIIATIKAVVILAGTGGAIWGLVSAVAALSNPVTAIIAAISALTAGLGFLFETNETFRNSVLGLWEDIKTLWGTLKDLFLPALMDLWQALKEALIPLWENLKSLFMEILPIIKLVGQIIGGYLFAAIKVITVEIKIWGEVLKFLTNLILDIIDIFKFWWESLKLGARIISEWVSNLRENFAIVDNIMTLFETAIGKVKDAFADIFSERSVIGTLKGILAQAGILLGSFLNNLGFKNTAGGIFDFVASLTEEDPIKAGRQAFKDNYETAGAQEETKIGVSPLSGGMNAGGGGGTLQDFNLDAEAGSRSRGGNASAGTRGRRVTINIENIVNELNINTRSMGESAEQIRQEVARALTAAITDAAVLTS